MKIFEFNSNEIYKNALIDVYNNGIEICPRKMKVRELLCYKMELNPNDNIITLPGFETNLSYANEELNWYYSGNNRIDWSTKIQKIWAKYSDDGITVNSNYGNRIFGKYDKIPINQWEWAKQKLIEDSDSRQAIINVNNAFDKENKTKDFPCCSSVQIFNRNNKLYWITHFRSQDCVLGFRNDFYCFTEMQKAIAKELGLELGTYIHIANSWHLYEKDFEKVKKLN